MKIFSSVNGARREVHPIFQWLRERSLGVNTFYFSTHTFNIIS